MFTVHLSQARRHRQLLLATIVSASLVAAWAPLASSEGIVSAENRVATASFQLDKAEYRSWHRGKSLLQATPAELPQASGEATGILRDAASVEDEHSRPLVLGNARAPFGTLGGGLAGAQLPRETAGDVGGTTRSSANRADGAGALAAAAIASRLSLNNGAGDPGALLYAPARCAYTHLPLPELPCLHSWAAATCAPCRVGRSDQR